MAKLVSADLTNNAELCILYYETTNRERLFLGRWSNAFDAKIISHTYDKVGTVIFEKPITCIGWRVFSDYANLKSITIPDSVTKIEKDAFEHCESLTSVYISNLSSWCRIDFANAYSTPFHYANNIYLNGELVTELTIPSDITKINNYTFYGCKCLTSITVPNSVTEIGENAFSGCRSLSSVAIPDSVTKIGENAFYNCNKLTSITIPNSVTEIGENAFSCCTQLATFYGKFTSLDNLCLIVDGVLKSFAIGCGATKYTIPDSVTEIGESAFFVCRSLTEVTIPDSVISIGESAFSNCTSLISVTIGNGVTSIDGSAFLYCASLTNVTIPNSVIEIGGSAFRGCRSLSSVAIPDSVTKIGDFAFAECSGELVINSKIVETDYNLLEYGVGTLRYIATGYWLSEAHFSHITIGNNIQKIGNNVFWGCSKLTGITIPNSVTKIGIDVFCDSCRTISIYISDLSSWCNIEFGVNERLMYFHNKKLYLEGKLLTKISVPSDVKEIKSFSFACLIDITSITIPDTVTAIGKEAFFHCRSLTSVYYNGDLSTWCKINFGGSLLNRYLWSANNIKTKLYINNKELTEIVIPTTVTKISPYAFCNLDSLTRVIICNGVTEIGENAFACCHSLTSITIPDSVTEIGDSAFSNCSGLTSITIPNSVTKIGDSAFSNCSSLTSITIGNGITSIGNSAFYKCGVLSNLIIGNNIVEFGKDVLKECNSLTSITTSDSTIETLMDALGKINVTNLYVNIANLAKFCERDKKRALGFYLLINDKEVTELIIPDGVTKIGEKAFACCRSLTSVTIPDSVTEIGDSAFSNCSGLTSITIPNSVTKIGKEAFCGCSNLTSVTISDNVTVIRAETFGDCKSLTNVIIPDSVTIIDEEAFWGCESLSHLTIGKKVSKIGNAAFWGSNIDTIICRATIPPQLHETYWSEWCEWRLNSFQQFETLVVPIGCEEAYSNSDWGRYIREETSRYDIDAIEQEYKDYQRQLRIESGDYYVNDIDDAEYESYLALGGDPEKYRKGCLDNFMDSIGM